MKNVRNVFFIKNTTLIEILSLSANKGGDINAAQWVQTKLTHACLMQNTIMSRNVTVHGFIQRGGNERRRTDFDGEI